MAITYFGEFAYPLIIGYFNYLLNGRDKPDQDSSSRTILLPFVRIATYIASSVRHVIFTLNDRSISRVVMNEKVRDELLERDADELSAERRKSKTLLINEIKHNLGSIERRTFAEGYLAGLGKEDYSELTEKQLSILRDKLYRMNGKGDL